MSENEEDLKKPRRKRRQFTPEFKAGAVKLVLAEGKSSTEVGEDYRRLLEQRGITCSMSRKGNCWDNADRLGYAQNIALRELPLR